MQLFEPSWFGGFWFSSRPRCRCGEQGRGCDRGRQSARTFFFICVTLRKRKESSRTLDITASVCRSHTCFKWHRGFAASELSRSLSPLPPSRLGDTEDRGCGVGRTPLRGERGCLPERCRAAEWKHASASGCGQRACDVGGAAFEGGGGQGGEEHGEAGGG